MSPQQRVGKHRVRTAIIMMCRQWFLADMFERKDEDNIWFSVVCGDESTWLAPIKNQISSFAPAPLSFLVGSALGKKMLLSLVIISFNIPNMIDGISSSINHEMSLVIDAEKGFVIVE